MSRRSSVRDRWYEAVIKTTLVNGACRELLSLMAVRHMTDRGYVKVPRKTLADELGIIEHRVTVRTGEAVRAGLLVRVGGGVNGQTVQYAAQIPLSEGAAERHPRPGVEGVAEAAPAGVAERHPDEPSEPGSGCRRTTPIRVRVTKRNHNNGTPPAAERDSPEQHSGSLEQCAPEVPAPLRSATTVAPMVDCDHPAKVKTTTGKCALCIVARHNARSAAACPRTAPTASKSRCPRPPGTDAVPGVGRPGVTP